MNGNDFLREKQIAAEKLREMNSRSRFKEEKKPEKKLQSNGSILGIPALDNLLKTPDTVLLVGLLLILMSENADKRLIFALIYILL